MQPTPQVIRFPASGRSRPTKIISSSGAKRKSPISLRRLGSHRFLSVTGTSGSGKSSLVRSGLIPSLHSGVMVKAGIRVARGRDAARRGSDRPSGGGARSTGRARAGRSAREHQPRAARSDAAPRLARHRRRGSARAPCARTRTCWLSSTSSRSCSASSDCSDAEHSRDEAIVFVKLLLEAVTADGGRRSMWSSRCDPISSVTACGIRACPKR